MNQILSVELPKKRTNTKRGQNNKASTKSVVTFFCIVLILFALALIGISLFSIFKLNNSNDDSKTVNIPRIDVSQNATELEVEIACSSEISKIEYNWEEKETETVNGNGRNNMSLSIDVPSGNNMFNITVTDIDGRTNSYSKEYTGAKAPNITVFDPSQEYNKIIVKCEENQIIKYMSYYYDEEQEKTETINNTTGLIKIDSRQGEHLLTIKVGYEDGTVGKKSEKVYASNVAVETNGIGNNYTKFIVKASDPRTIEKVKLIFNGVETIEEVNQNEYTKEIELKPGEPGSNRLEVVVYNKDKMVISKRVMDRNRQN